MLIVLQATDQKCVVFTRVKTLKKIKHSRYFATLYSGSLNRDGKKAYMLHDMDDVLWWGTGS